MQAKKRQWSLNLIGFLSILTGVFTLGSTLYGLLNLHHARIVLADAHFTVIAAISLVYLGLVLRRGKYNAWLISIPIYLFLLIRNLRHFVFDDELTKHYVFLLLSNLALPIFMLLLLIYLRPLFKVKSEVLSFKVALQRAVIVLLIAFLYGVIGFQLFDEHDFHQEISSGTAVHYTVDQFGLTTNNQPTAYSRRAVFFVDSLASVSLASLAYVVIAFFAPVKFRLSGHQLDHELAEDIVMKYAKTSEDFFKLWPQDKAYFFNEGRSALIAYKVTGNVALCVGDPLGKPSEVKKLTEDFLEFCRNNDWRPAFIHVDESNFGLYEKNGLDVQKIGEEAIVDVEHFMLSVRANKYFRNIRNRFSKLGYSFEMLSPPYGVELVNRLREVSNDWLIRPGRAERTFMLGYFTPEYINQCRIALVKNSEGKVEAFLNQVPTCFSAEANYDFLRHATGSPSNINDFLMINFLEHLSSENYAKLNMGLCPLSGLDDQPSDDKSLVDSVLRFAYTNGSRFYSFEGLKRFKSKFEPEWKDRYVVYSGGLAGFGLTLNALLRAMTSLPKRLTSRK